MMDMILLTIVENADVWVVLLLKEVTNNITTKHLETNNMKQQTDEKANPLTYWGGLQEPKKQTAVEWLAEQMMHPSIYNPYIEQAKEMEKQNIIDAWENGYKHGACVNEDKNKFHGIQYYNETTNND